MEISDKDFIVDDELPDDGIYEDDDGEMCLHFLRLRDVS